MNVKLTEAERESLARVEYREWHGMGEAFDPSWADHLIPAVTQIIAARVGRALRDAALAMESEDWWDEGSEYAMGDNDGKRRAIGFVRDLADEWAGR